MIIHTPKDMFILGQSLSKQHKILLLNGELGAGKTILTKGFASGLGIDENMVQSPTYAYINSYQDKILHMDMYRIESFEDLMEKGILDQIMNHEYIVIERPKFIDQLGIENYQELEILKIDETTRDVKLKN